MALQPNPSMAFMVKSVKLQKTTVSFQFQVCCSKLNRKRSNIKKPSKMEKMKPFLKLHEVKFPGLWKDKLKKSLIESKGDEEDLNADPEVIMITMIPESLAKRETLKKPNVPILRFKCLRPKETSIGGLIALFRSYKLPDGKMVTRMWPIDAKANPIDHELGTTTFSLHLEAAHDNGQLYFAFEEEDFPKVLDR